MGNHTPNLKISSLSGLLFSALLALIVVGVALDVPSEWRTESGFLGTGASLMADLTLLAYILILVPLMLTGYAFARNKQFVPHHQVVMTAIVIFNWGLISFIMASSFDGIRGDAADNLGDSFYLLPVLHAILGFSAQLLGSYLVLRMWFEDELPNALLIKNIKLPMRLTLAGWLLAAMLGIGTYVTWYEPFAGPDAQDGPAPVQTEESAPVQTEESAP